MIETISGVLINGVSPPRFGEIQSASGSVPTPRFVGHAGRPMSKQESFNRGGMPSPSGAHIRRAGKSSNVNVARARRRCKSMGRDGQRTTSLVRVHRRGLYREHTGDGCLRCVLDASLRLTYWLITSAVVYPPSLSFQTPGVDEAPQSPTS